MRRPLLLALGLLALVVLVGACATKKEVKLAPLSVLPAEIQKAPVPVRESYQFALANQETMKQIPCYCGCGTQGHKSVKDCFVKEVRADGSVEWDQMGFG